MGDMARVKLFLSLFMGVFLYADLTIQVELMCEVANVKVENEDGRTQVFEMKKLESIKGEPCTSCANAAVNSAPQLSALKSQLVLSVSDKEISPECDSTRYDLPAGLCTFNSDVGSCHQPVDPETCSHTLEELAEEIVYKSMVPMATGDENIDKHLAVAVVQMNVGNIDGAIGVYSDLIKERPNTLAAYYGRGVAYTRKGLQASRFADQAIADFSEVLQRDPKFRPGFEKRAEVYISLGQYNLALDDLSSAIELYSDSRALFARGVVNLLLEDFVTAEADFKKNLDGDGDDNQNLFYLGLTLYYRGKIRNAIEVFKEVLKKDPDHLDSCTSLAQAFREVGNIRSSRHKFNQSLVINPHHVLTLRLRGDLFYHRGDPREAIHDFTKCVKEDPANVQCEYMSALSSVAMGNFYDGVKTATKVMVKNVPLIQASPDFIKAHYLREYARYLHANLDNTLESLDMDADFHEEFKDHWLKVLPFEFQTSYKEQPGIQPHIRDIGVYSLSDYPRSVQNLICKAHKLGWLMQVNTDGYTPNNRLNLAMGLSSIHIAQLYESRWRGLRQNKPFDSAHTWRDLFNIAVQYRQLVDPGQPVFWLDQMPDHRHKDGYKTDIVLVKGSVHNIKTMPYFDLVFKLVKTMLEHYSISNDVTKTKAANHKDEIDRAKTCEDLLDVTKKYQLNQKGFMVMTQVPSTRKRTDKDRLEGAMLVLTEDVGKRIVFTLDVANTKPRTLEYHAELEYIYNQLQDEIRRSGSSKVSDMESVVKIILTMAYYYYNLMPLSRGSSVVAYTVALGLIMSVGKQVTGKLPTGKLMEMEAMLSGAPDAFILVTKQWMAIKRLNSPISSYPKVWETFPTLRSVLEVLNVNTESC